MPSSELRIQHHPILGDAPARRQVTFYLDGQPLSGFEGEPIAVALLANGIRRLRYSKKYGSPRGIFCAVGQCNDCIMTVDGKANVRTCFTPLGEGMKVQTQGTQQRNRSPSEEL